MAGDLRGFALEKAELISSRLKELLSSGEGYVRTHFGVDLGLKAELYPPWVILLTAAVGLLLAASCAAVCSGLLGRKKRRSTVTTEGSTEPDKALLAKNNTRSEDLKKKNKKRLSEKKNQSNGQPVSVSQEEDQANEKLSPKVKAEKVHEVQAPAQVKKNKKKKPDAKPTQQTSAADGKETDDGAWETKVSNREKRQQRKKERGPDDSGSPGVETPKTHAEGPGLKANKKNKGNHDSQPSRSSGKGDASGAATSSWREEASNNSAGWTDMSLKMSAQMGTLEGPKWGTIPATQPWTQEAQAWSGIDSRMKNDLNPVSFSMLGLSTTEPVANSVDLQWTNQDVTDEWSGFNGMAAVDPTSDWNAPLEHWGNYEESVMVTPVLQIKEQAVINKLSEDEKDSEDPSEAAGKSKRKKRKKKTEEEAVTQTMNSAPKRQELPAQASHKSNISSSQKKAEETVEAPKPTQKKKVRKET